MLRCGGRVEGANVHPGAGPVPCRQEDRLPAHLVERGPRVVYEDGVPIWVYDEDEARLIAGQPAASLLRL